MSMDLDKLLYSSESVFLDFKSEQYCFDGASDEKKSELLKDILGFANAFNSGMDSYILIGVKENEVPQHEVLGLREGQHLQDHTLQQFVNSKTNRNITFSYSVVLREDKSVGVITIKDQEGPFYLKKKFGRLDWGKVYIRRGTSIDISNPASPEEISMMGSRKSSLQPDIRIEFADTLFNKFTGNTKAMDFEKCDVPSWNEIPDLKDAHDENLSYFPGAIRATLETDYTNEDYYRELMIFESRRKWLRPFRLGIQNKGEVSSIDTRLEIEIPVDGNILFQDVDNLPKCPKPKKSIYDLNPNISHMLSSNVLKRVEVTTDALTQSVVICLGDIQPGRSVLSEKFYVGVNNDGPALLPVRVFASNLSMSIVTSLTINAEVVRSELSIKDLQELPFPYSNHYAI